MLQRLVVPGILTLLFLATLCATPSAVALAETGPTCGAAAAADVSPTHARIRTHHAFPRCPEGEGFAEPNRRKQPIGSTASNLNDGGLAEISAAQALLALDPLVAPIRVGSAGAAVPHSYDPQGPPVDTV